MNRIKKSFSLKVVLWVVVIAITIFLLSLGVLFRQSRKLVRTESVEQTNVALNAAMQRISRYLVTAETAANTYAWLAEQSMQADKLQELMRKIVLLNPYIDGCAISTEPGVVPRYEQRFMTFAIREQDSIRTGIEQTVDYFCHAWYDTPRSQRKPCWIVFYDKANALDMGKEGMIAAYSKPLYDAKKRFAGVISAEMALVHLSKIISETKPYPNSYYMLIDEQGRYVAHPDSTRLFNRTIFNVENPQQQSDIIALGYEMTKGKQGSMFVNVDGQKSLVCYRPVSGTPWSLAIVCPESDILQGYNQLTLIVIPLLLVGLFLIVVNCYKAVTVSIRPLSLLLETTRSIAEGDMTKTIPHTERTDVIGGLQNSFATMQESLNSYLESINEASEQNQQYNQELEHTMQMAMESERQKTIFIQNVTHQIRTPLNIIMGFAQVLNNMPKDENPSSGLSSEELKNIVQSMTYNSKQLIRMVLMLYDSSENGQKMTRKLHIEKVAVDATMKEMLNYIHEESPDVDIAYSNSLPDGFCMDTDRRSIGFSIYELLHNAIKYSDKQHISLHVEQEDGRVRFIVQDTGSGISDTNREYIFNFFVKADRYSEGLGLGLPLAMRHAQMLGGQLTLDTGYQEGCRFIFEIPI